MDVLKVRHYHRDYDSYGRAYSHGSSGEYNDFVAVLAACGGVDALAANDRIERSPINEDVIFDIVDRNNMKTFDIQTLNKPDVECR